MTASVYYFDSKTIAGVIHWATDQFSDWPSRNSKVTALQRGWTLAIKFCSRGKTTSICATISFCILGLRGETASVERNAADSFYLRVRSHTEKGCISFSTTTWRHPSGTLSPPGQCPCVPRHMLLAVGTQWDARMFHKLDSWSQRFI